MSDEHAHDAHHVNYTAIFGVLCICTLLSIIFDVSKAHFSRPVLICLILGVAACKATFVLLYFMHIKFETAWKYILLAPTTVLACCLPFALAPDITYHYYNVIVPQSYVVQAHGAEGEEAAEHHTGADKHDDHAHGDSKKKSEHGAKKGSDAKKKEAHPEPKK